MSQIPGGFHLTKEDVKVVQQAIREGRVLTWLSFEEVPLPYDPDLWDEEAIRDWLERTHLQKRAKQILSQLRRGQTIKSRSISPPVIHALARTRVHEKGLYLSEGRPNAESRFDTSATSLTNSMTWIPPSTSVCCSLSREARRGEFPIARYPVACPCFVRVSFFYA